MIATELTARFQQARWSETRKRIFALQPGQSLAFPRSEYFNAHASVRRLNEACGKRMWVIATSGGCAEQYPESVVRRIA